MVSTPEGLTNNITMSIITFITINKPSSRKPIRQFSKVWDIKQKTSVCRLGAAKSNANQSVLN